MRKILTTLFLFFGFINFTYSSEDIKIISREEWGANEEYRYLDSTEWEEILESRDDYTPKPLTEWQKKKVADERLANTFLKNSFSYLTELESYDKFDGDRELAWPISKTDSVKSIIIHHTHSEYEDSYDGIRKIYKYHAVSRQWGDIGYNFLIGNDGEIFEGRAGGDYVVGAHDKYNNRSTVGIALIGDFDDKDISNKQYKALKSLVEHLVEKYDINLAEKQPFFKWCNGLDCKFPLDVEYMYPMVGHRDAGHTDCPGEKLYETMEKIRTDILKKQANFDVEKVERLLNRIDFDKLLGLLVNIEKKLDQEYSSKLYTLKQIIFNIEKSNNLKDIVARGSSYDKNNKIKVKLSYPYDNYINLEISGKMEPKLIKRENEYELNFSESEELKNKKYLLKFTLSGDELILNGNKLVSLKDGKFFRITVPEGHFSIIESWDRKPGWDKTGELNDNKFKGDIVLYKKDKKLIVVNDVLLADYLKGLGEVSNFEVNEKIETIIVLARTYARWYMDQARKFPGEWYDASDDPNVFQKYLGYGLEQRSPRVNKIVDKTEDIVITYENEIIKPWYFSKSNGRTLSFYDYCIKNNNKKVFCETESQKYPFLSSSDDLGSDSNTYLGHGVGVPGTGVKYFSERGWPNSLILKYFLKGVNLKKM